MQKLNYKIIIVKNNCGSYQFSSIGNNLCAVVGFSKRMQDEYEYSITQASVIDIDKGKTIWTVEHCFGHQPLPLVGENAVYVARDLDAKYFLTAHNPTTGNEIWKCPLSGNSNQFCTPLTQNDKYILHSNSKTIFVVDKEKGKVVNKIKLQHQYAERIVVIPWNDMFIYPEYIVEGKGKSKTTKFVLSIYANEKEDSYKGTVLEVNEDVVLLGYKLIGDILCIVTSDSIVRLVDLNAKKVTLEYDFVPNGDQTSKGYLLGCSDFYQKDNVLTFILRTDAVERNAEGSFDRYLHLAKIDLLKNKIDTLQHQYDEFVKCHSYRNKRILLVGYSGVSIFDDKLKNEQYIDLSENGRRVDDAIFLEDEMYVLQMAQGDDSFVAVLKYE